MPIFHESMLTLGPDAEYASKAEIHLCVLIVIEFDGLCCYLGMPQTLNLRFH